MKTTTHINTITQTKNLTKIIQTLTKLKQKTNKKQQKTKRKKQNKQNKKNTQLGHTQTTPLPTKHNK